MDYTIDAKGKRLGRVATDVALILQGKRSPDYAPQRVGRDRAIVKNYQFITVSGTKFRTMLTHRHTGYMGHVKTLTFGQRFERDPKGVLREAVRHMLPKNFLNQKRIRNLVFVEE